MNIQEPARSRIIQAGPSLAEAVAWALYARQQPGLDNPAGYLVRRLSSGDAPPTTFLRLAQVSWEQWRAYAAVCYLGGTALAGFADDEAFALWREQYGASHPDDLPYGAGAGLAELPYYAIPASPPPAAAAHRPAAVDEADETLWRDVLDELSLQMTHATFNSWLRDARLLARDGSQFVVGVRDEAACDWLAHRLQEPVVRTLRSVAREPEAAVQFVAVPAG